MSDTHPSPAPSSDADFARAKRAVELGLLSRGAVESAIVAGSLGELVRSLPSEASGRKVGRYHLGTLLGKGGMGMVYRAWDADLGRWVALKFLKSIGDETARAYFRREAQLAAALEHPNIAKIYEVGEHEGAPFIAMQLVEGETLTKPNLEVVRKIAEAVAYAHSKGIIHRDLKPSNVMVDLHGQAYVMDFGLAKETRVDGETVTATQAVLGTPNYMAPEQARSRATAQSDVYSIGAILYELTTGRPPFVGETAGEVLAQVVTAEPIRPRSLAPGIAPDLEAIVLKALEKDPKRRYTGASEMLEDLRALAAGEPLRHARRATIGYVLAKRIRRQPLLWTFGAALATAVAAGATFGSSQLLRAAREARRAQSESERRVREVSVQRDRANEEEGKAREREKEARQAENRARHREWDSRLEASRALYERSFGLSEQGRHSAAAACLLRALEIAPREGRPPDFAVALLESGWAEEAWIRYRSLDSVRPHVERTFPLRFQFGDECALSGDGRTLLVVEQAGAASVWEAPTRRSRGQLLGEAKSFTVVSLNRDGSVAALATRDGEIWLWNVASRAPLRRLAKSPSPVSSLLLTRDGGRVFAVLQDGAVRGWDVVSGVSAGETVGEGESFLRAQIDESGARVATARRDGTLRVRELASGREVWTSSTRPILSWCLSFASHGTRLLVGRSDGAIAVLESETGRETHRWETGAGYVGALSVSPDGTLAVSCGGHDLRVWEVETGRLLHRIETQGIFLGGGGAWFGWSGDRLLATVDGAIRVWRLPPRSETRRLTGLTSPVWRLVVGPDGRTVAGGCMDGTIAVWDLSTGPDPVRLEGHTGRIISLAFAGPRELVSGSIDDTVRTWNLDSGRQVAEVKNVENVSFSSDGKIGLDLRKTGRLWNVRTGETIADLRGVVLSRDVLLSADGRRILGFGSKSSGERTAVIWHPREKDRMDVVSRRILVGHDGDVNVGDLSTDGNMAATGSMDGTIRVWDIASRSELRRMVPGGFVHRVRFSPGARVIAACSKDSLTHGEWVLTLWEVISGKRLRSEKLAPGLIPDVAFTPDGSSVLVGGADRSVRVWDLTSASRRRDPPRLHAEDDDDPYWEFEREYRDVGVRVYRDGPNKGDLQVEDDRSDPQAEFVDRMVRELHSRSPIRKSVAAAALAAYGRIALPALVTEATPEARAVEREIRRPPTARSLIAHLRKPWTGMRMSEADIASILELIESLSGVPIEVDPHARVAGKTSLEVERETLETVLTKTLKPLGYVAVPNWNGRIFVTTEDRVHHAIPARIPLRLGHGKPVDVADRVAELASPDPERRKSAEEALLVPGAEDALWKALDAPNADVAGRSADLLKRFYDPPIAEVALPGGERALDLRDRDVGKALRLIAEATGLDLVFDASARQWWTEVKVDRRTAQQCLRYLSRMGLQNAVVRGCLVASRDRMRRIVGTSPPEGPLLWVEADRHARLSDLIDLAASGNDVASQALVAEGAGVLIPLRHAERTMEPAAADRLGGLRRRILEAHGDRCWFVDEPAAYLRQTDLGPEGESVLRALKEKRVSVLLDEKPMREVARELTAKTGVQVVSESDVRLTVAWRDRNLGEALELLAGVLGSDFRISGPAVVFP